MPVPPIGNKDGFDLTRRMLGSQVEDINMDELELSPERIGKFDVVLFCGVLYHLQHPLLALERVYSVTKELLIAESHVDLQWRHKPTMMFYPDAELAHDPTNWWGPDPSAFVAMVRAAGFSQVKELARWPSFSFRFGRAVKVDLRRPRSFWPMMNWSRMVVHGRP